MILKSGNVVRFISVVPCLDLCPVVGIVAILDTVNACFVLLGKLTLLLL